MKMLDVKGMYISVDVKPSSYPVREVSKSKLQKAAGDKLKEIYPHEVILEEFVLPGSKLRLDFFLPHKGLCLEIDGGQHDEFTPFFHGDRSSSNKFIKQGVNDRSKVKWANDNGFTLVAIKGEKDIGKLDRRI